MPGRARSLERCDGCGRYSADVQNSADVQTRLCFKCRLKRQRGEFIKEELKKRK